jgi:preprotein translocase subunit SecG
MDWMTIVIGVHVLIALGIIGLVLLQHGKGADMGSGFGGGASGSLFGATGSANFLSRATAVLATLFFLTSLGLAYLATNKPRSGGGVLDAVKTQQQAPAADGKSDEKAPAKAPEKPAAETPPASSKPKDVPQ